MKKDKRKLVAIMFTDIVGYSANSQKDEALALELLQEHNNLLRPVFIKHDGIEIKTIGDAFLVEFPSALEAVNSAIEIQKLLRERNEIESPKRQIKIRIGIHLGDVIHRDGDVLGDGVNITFRIEPLAEPGGICLSGQVYYHIHNKIHEPLVSIGKQYLKNIDSPVEVFRVVLPWQTAGPFQPRTKISHYRILEKIGSGGMGVVYKAEDINLKRNVALKFLPAELTHDPESKQRFIYEAQAASALEHKNLCTIHEIDETDDGKLFTCMTYYGGETLNNKIKQGALKVDESVKLALQVCEGLDRAHQSGIVHRDIKPGNLIVTENGEIKIVDFGLAMLAGQSRITKAGMAVGTATYMSPEQIQGKNIDSRTDIWSLGIVLHELVTGDVPFKGENDQAVMYSILNINPEPVSKINKKIPVELERIINKCLQKNVNNRYSTVIELEKDLTNFKNNVNIENAYHQKDSIPVSKMIPVRPFWNKIFVPIITLLLIVLTLLIFPTSGQKIGGLLGFSQIPDVMHLAVLPFSNLGGNESSNQAFVDGLTETLVSKISQIEQYQDKLWIVPNCEINENNIKNASEIKQAFPSITLVVAGSIQFFNKDLRINLSLINTKNLRVIVSRTMDYAFENLFDLQDKMVLEFSEMLDLELTSQSEEILTIGNTSNPEACDLYFQASGYLLRSDDIDNINLAIQLFKKSVKLDSSYALAYAGLGEAYWLKYEADKNVQWVEPAIKYCNQAIELNNQVAPVHVSLGIINAGSGNYDESIRNFNRALQIDSVCLDAYRELAMVFETLNDLEKAEKLYKKTIQLNPDYWRSYNDIGGFYYYQGRYEDAIQNFTSVVNLTPDNIKGYNNLATSYLCINDDLKAKQIFDKSIAIRPSYTAYSNLGYYSYYEGDYEHAVSIYKKTLEIFDEDYRIWGFLADSYYWISGMRDSSIVIYKRAIDLAKIKLTVNSQDIEILADLAGYYGRIEKNSEAILILNDLSKSEHKNNDIIIRLADTYEQLGMRKEAIHWMEILLKTGYSVKDIINNPGLGGLVADEDFKNLLDNN